MSLEAAGMRRVAMWGALCACVALALERVVSHAEHSTLLFLVAGFSLSIAMPRGDRRYRAWGLLAVCAWVVVWRFSVNLGKTVLPLTWDAEALALDRMGSIHPSFAVGALFFPLRSLREHVSALFALALVCPVFLLRAPPLRYAKELFVFFLCAIVANLLFPLAGPAQAFSHVFPFGTPVPSPLAIPSSRTAAVSLPIGGALLVVLSEWATARRRLAWALVWLVALVELGFGHVYLSTAALSLLLAYGVHRVTRSDPPHEVPPKADPLRWGLALAFFVSGFAALVYEVVFSKSLAYTFGSTSVASTTVLVTYMGGLALGSAWGGGIAARTRHPIRVYAWCEVAIGAWCVLSPWLFRVARGGYVALLTGEGSLTAKHVALQCLLGAAVLGPPTTLMGITMPVLLKCFLGQRTASSVSLLYGANTFGAALGAICAGYIFLPRVGISGALGVAVFANVLAASVGYGLFRLTERRRKESAASPKVLRVEEPTPAQVTRVREVRARAGGAAVTSIPVVGFCVLLVGGIVTLALEVTYTHLLAVVAGSSAFAFSLMLFSFLLGLAFGARLAKSMLRVLDTVSALVVAEGGLAVCILLGIFFWDRMPRAFEVFGRYPVEQTFAVRELFRFVICTLLMVPPSVAIGMAYPLAMDLVAPETSLGAVKRMGTASALNTVGNIVGALLAGFVLLPRMGSLATLDILAAASSVLAGLAWSLADKRARLWLIPLAGCVAVLFAVHPRTLDATRLSTGANVYFRNQSWGTIVDHAESLDGGFTAVAVREIPGGAPLRTLLTNGKFQGNSSERGEMRAQYGIALFPLLHQPARQRALVIGYGTGVSAHVLSEAGFSELVIAELSRDIVALADRHFRTENGDVTSAPNVSMRITDGRNLLLLEPQPYDLISMEVSSIWFAGAAALYSKDFYELVKARLKPGGVLQQWVQLHRLEVRDLASILGTVQSVFPHVWLYYDEQGVIVACNEKCTPSLEAHNRIRSEPRLEHKLSLLGGVERLERARIADPERLSGFLSSVVHRVSTDDNLHLEYQTPRANVRDAKTSLEENLRAIVGGTAQ